MNITDLLELLIERFVTLPSAEYVILPIFVVFVAVYRWGVHRWIKFRVFDGRRYKLLECTTCFAFWLLLITSTNITTAAIGYLIYNYYEQR